MRIYGIIEEGEGDMPRNYCLYAKNCEKRESCASTISHATSRPTCFCEVRENYTIFERDEKKQIKLFEDACDAD